MKFTFDRRACEFGGFNNRWEKNGPDVKVKAIDLPFKLPIKPKELDMLCPANGIKLSKFLFGENLRKPELQTNVLPHLKLARKPQIKGTIFDSPTDKRKQLQLSDCTVKEPTVEIEQDGGLFLVGKLQFHPGNQLQRINDNVENHTLDFECQESAPELFDQAEDEDEAGEDGKQGELMNDPDADDEDDDENDKD